MIGLEFNSEILVPALVDGTANAALYGVLAMTLILGFRISGGIAFVQAGNATIGGFLYWYLTTDPDSTPWGTQGVPKLVGLAMIMVVGAAAGVVYNAVTTVRMANFPRVTVSVFGVGAALFAAGLMSTVFPGVSYNPVESPVEGKERIFGYYVTHLQLLTIVLLVVTCALLSYVLQRTRSGVYVRAIAADAEGAEMVGIHVHHVGGYVWAIAGAIGALAGAITVSQTALHEFALIFLVLRSLAAGMVGGFDSFSLGIAGAILLGGIESTVASGVFGTVSSGVREVVLMTVLLAVVSMVNRKRPVLAH